jgi:hypothetical protein
MDALAIADRSMRIAAGMCVYTNTSFSADAIGPALTDEERARYAATPLVRY